MLEMAESQWRTASVQLVINASIFSTSPSSFAAASIFKRVRTSWSNCAMSGDDLGSCGYAYPASSSQPSWKSELAMPRWASARTSGLLASSDLLNAKRADLKEPSRCEAMPSPRWYRERRFDDWDSLASLRYVCAAAEKFFSERNRAASFASSACEGSGIRKIASVAATLPIPRQRVPMMIEAKRNTIAGSRNHW